MKFSYALLPDHPVGELVDSIVLTDELGFFGAYGADEAYQRTSGRSPPWRRRARSGSGSPPA